MLELSLGFMIIAIITLSFTLLMVGLTIIPWCSKKCNRDKQHHTTTWSRLAIPEQDRFTASIPPLPPYLFVTGIKYDGFLETV